MCLTVRILGQFRAGVRLHHNSCTKEVLGTMVRLFCNHLRLFGYLSLYHQILHLVDG